ncbi:hypothetical protein CISIN_1g043689mg, partial [Citrus sinensis]
MHAKNTKINRNKTNKNKEEGKITELLTATSNCDIVTQFECNGKSSWPEL